MAYADDVVDVVVVESKRLVDVLDLPSCIRPDDEVLLRAAESSARYSLDFEKDVSRKCRRDLIVVGVLLDVAAAAADHIIDHASSEPSGRASITCCLWKLTTLIARLESVWLPASSEFWTHQDRLGSASLAAAANHRQRQRGLTAEADESERHPCGAQHLYRATAPIALALVAHRPDATDALEQVAYHMGLHSQLRDDLDDVVDDLGVGQWTDALQVGSERDSANPASAEAQVRARSVLEPRILSSLLTAESSARNAGLERLASSIHERWHERYRLGAFAPESDLAGRARGAGTQ